MTNHKLYTGIHELSTITETFMHVNWSEEGLFSEKSFQWSSFVIPESPGLINSVK